MTDTNKNTGEEYSFYQLIKRFSIEIPIIQRDYAQGRDSKEEIRENLLEDLYKAIDIKSLHLDFVYGSKKEDNGNIKFIPLDGQQRLTTLFLLHWYLANKDEKLDELKSVFLNENKSKFTYETRISSRDFCTELVLKGISIPFDAESKISDTIKNASWFFLSWEKDPTIKSMLVMLDAIHNRFKNANDFFDKLINPNIYESPITFQFLPLDKFGLTDNLYIKMNARGKPLTDFENFKAKFEQHLKEKKYDLAFISSFTHKMDCEWTDMFWSYKENYLIDNQFMNFFRVIATNTFALKNLPAKQNEVISLLRDNSKKMPISFYIKLNCFDSKGIKDIEQTLDSLKNGTS